MARLARGSAPAVVAAALAVAGCGTSSPSHTPHGSGGVQSSDVAASAAAVETTADPSIFPSTDTPIASASPALRAAWQPYRVTTIPSRHIFDNIPAMPPIQNDTNGQLSDAEAAEYEAAFFREAALEKWADGHGETFLRSQLLGSTLQNTPVDAALAAHQTLETPDCEFFPTAVSIWPVDDATRSFLAAQHSPTQGRNMLALNFAKCSAEATDRNGDRYQIYSFAGIDVTLLSGAVNKDRVLGSVFVADAGASCGSPGAPAQPCGR